MTGRQERGKNGVAKKCSEGELKGRMKQEGFYSYWDRNTANLLVA